MGSSGVGLLREAMMNVGAFASRPTELRVRKGSGFEPLVLEVYRQQ